MRETGGKSAGMLAALGVAAAILLAVPTPAAATLAGLPPLVSVQGDRGALDKQEAADAKVVIAAHKAMLRKRGPGLEPFLPRLRAILARAPEVYPLVEQRDDGHILARTVDEALIVPLMLKYPTLVDFRYDTYVDAAYMLGWYYNEVGRPEEALEPLARGLAMRPGEPAVTSEQNIAMISLGRFQEAIEANDLALGQAYMTEEIHAALLRNRGYLLVKLGRLDEAEAAYNELLRIAPGDSYAIDGLQAISRRRAAQP